MHFIREKLTGQFQDKATVGLLSALGDSFKPVIYGATQELYKYLPEEGETRVQRGDLFVTPTKDLFYYNFSPNCDSIVAGAVCNSARARVDWTKFREAISRVLGSKGWQSDVCCSEKFQILREETTPLIVSEWERRAAIALQRPELRQMVKIIASQPAISLQEVAGDRLLFEVNEDVQLLENLGIITREFEVYCLDNQQKVSCVANLSALEEASKRGFKCFHCGRPISSERVVQSLSITENGRKLATKNMWLAFLVGAALSDEGVDCNNISYRREGEEIVEVFADVEGALFIFSVSESEITPDMVFRFFTRVSFFNADWGYLVTPILVNKDTRAVIESSGDKVSVVEYIDGLNKVIREGVRKASYKMIFGLLGSFNAMTEIGIGTWANNYLNYTVASKESESKTSEDNLTSTEEIDNTYQLVDNIVGITESNIDYIGDDTNSVSSVNITDKYDEDLDDGEEDVEDTKNSDKSEFGQIVKSIVDLLPTACETNDTDSLNELMSKVTSEEGHSIMIATPDGMPFLGHLDTVEDSDLIAAMQLDLMQNITNIAMDNGLGTLESILICNDKATMTLYTSSADLNLITHQLKAEIDSVEIKRKKPNQKLKKALQGLVSLPGVTSGMVITIEGNSIQNIGFNRDRALSSCFAQMMNKVIKGFCNDIGFDNLRACIVTTDESSYHIICLGEKHYLVSELSSKVPPYVWRNDISAEASLVLAAL